MVNHRNNNGHQPSNSVGMGTISTTIIEPIPSNASVMVTPSTLVVPTTLPEGTISSPILQSHLVTPTPVVASDYKPFATNFTMSVPGRAGEYDNEVRHISLNGEKYAHNISKKGCSCRMWMLTELPCFYVMSCMKDQHLQIDDFVPDCYKKELFEACYAPVIYPINGEALWTKYDDVDIQPPPIKRQPERPKKKRN
ncbi:hypothetical protein KIW84_063475 [Lathyrus oleraceus]|uniref:SWIM-type domain-containing protein n=1 Tax=Pisum sativum TaxID=3888 RepID=A0A9D4W8W6_PEA|nr:hypothetical protein KIW84_063475 [Pisum sativum]